MGLKSNKNFIITNAVENILSGKLIIQILKNTLKSSNSYSRTLRLFKDEGIWIGPRLSLKN